MTEYTNRSYLLLSLQRALLGRVNSATLQVSIELNESRHIVFVRYEVESDIGGDEKENLSCATAEVISDFLHPWTIEEQFLSPPGIAPLAHIAYRRSKY